MAPPRKRELAFQNIFSKFSSGDETARIFTSLVRAAQLPEQAGYRVQLGNQRAEAPRRSNPRAVRSRGALKTHKGGAAKPQGKADGSCPRSAPSVEGLPRRERGLLQSRPVPPFCSGSAPVACRQRVLSCEPWPESECSHQSPHLSSVGMPTCHSFRQTAHNMLRLVIACLFSLLLLLAAESAVATDNYSYKAHEYATISDGRSPDGRWSIAAHGGGDYGYNGFDLYLMREPAHIMVAPLRVGEHLDTAPLSNIALWSPDSAHVVLLYRIDRHVLDLRLFAVADGKVQPMRVPMPFDVVAKPHLKKGVQYEVFSRLYRVTWRQADRLILAETDTLDAHRPIFGAGLEAYLKMDQRGPERTFTDFSAQGAYGINARGELRLNAVKALPQSSWSKPIRYSPHLIFDTEGGLHSTETTLSSLAAQKGSK